MGKPFFVEALERNDPELLQQMNSLAFRKCAGIRCFFRTPSYRT
jgi:hypothetical protein